MTLRIWTHPRYHDVPQGTFRPITLTLTCDAGGPFCEPFEREGSLAEGYIALASQATDMGWLDSDNRNFCPSCAKLRRAA